MNIKLAFDIYGTIINTSGIAEILKTHIGLNTEEFIKIWRSKQLEYSFRRAAMDLYVNFDTVTDQALEFTCDELGIQLSKDQRIQIINSYRSLPKFDDTDKSLQNLKNIGFSINAFSNGSEESLKALFQYNSIEKIFEKTISLENIQVYKPTKSAYFYLLKELNAEPQEVYLISGNSFDIIGASNCGIKTIWLNRTGSTFDPWEFKPDHEVKSLEEIFKILKK
ncbi:haloacid dehalogenase type II [Mangrovivirga sp. M17]|uniref:Haloacid dehalogenase type II n=1 Tax=Mangrovivirga halotolerans TaxID=2993936 RepID=A0ABT3RMV5_9BACT|nr:haloacid dehalogenase type II [Mangrovivirga halotolerans]MCX2743089.1 haloacid dehalogenase type II [Mangrovivirga halotolerans]